MNLLIFSIVLFFGFILILSSLSTEAYGANDITVEGYLNILHSHQKDGSSSYDYHLFDFDTFTRPTIILEFSNQIPIEDVFKLSGTNVIVKGTITGDFFNPRYQTMHVTSIKPNGVIIELDQKTYSWTDKVFITIYAPAFNLDSNAIDTIGTNTSNSVTISTRGSNLQNYKLVESNIDSGIFNGEITLTGFLHDADGNANTGDGHGFDTTPKTLGIGPINGFLESDNDDGITVSFEISPNETVIGSALIRWNIGTVEWLKSNYSVTGTGIVRVIDPDMNLDPGTINNIVLEVWSDSDAGGIDLTVTETNANSGVFEGTVFFTNIDESSGHRLRVAEGDTVTAEYEDNTLPDPYTTADELDILGSTKIDDNLIFFENPKSSNIDKNLIQVLYQNQNELPKIHKITHYGLPHYELSPYEDFSLGEEYRTTPVGMGVPDEFTALVVPIKFEDSDSVSKEKNYLQQIFFSQDSLLSYWNANSYGKFRLTGEVLDWKELQNTKKFYTDNNGSLRSWQLWDDFSEQIAPSIDFDGSDGNQNGNPYNLLGDGDKGDDIDQIFFIVTQDTSEDQPSLEPKASSYLNPHALKIASDIHWVFPTFIVDGGEGFPIGPEYQKGYGALAHEMGHNFIWHHTPMSKPFDTYSDPWSLMSGINDEKAPPGVVSFLKKKAHWIDAENRILKIEPGQSKLVKLNYLYSNSMENQYQMAEVPFGSAGNFYTIEARKENKFDHIPTQTGLLIYHFNPDGFGEDIRSEHEREDPLSVVHANKITCSQENENGICIKANYEDLSVKSGQTFVDSQNKIKIKRILDSDNSMLVCISNNGVPPASEILLEHNIPKINESLKLAIEFRDCFGELLNNVVYDISITQGNSEELVENIQSDIGSVTYSSSPLHNDASSQNPVEVKIKLHPNTEFSTTINKNIQVVPEFDAMVILTLSISIITMIVLTSRLSLKKLNF